MPENKNIKKIISSPVVHALLIYISSGWIVLEMTDYFISHYDLTERFRDILLIIMIVGLPIALFLHKRKTNRRREGSGCVQGSSEKTMVLDSGNYSDRSFDFFGRKIRLSASTANYG